MKIVHVSDSHLGFSAYSKSDPELGINQREADFYSAFAQAIDKAVDLAPDMIIHSGDLFDKAQPHNRAISFALRQMIRLSESGIQTVVVSGNHSTPRLRETGSIFGIFDHLEGVHPVYEPGIARIATGDLTVHAMPHSTDPPMSAVIKGFKASTDTKFNVLAIHAGIHGSDTYRMDDLNEQAIDMESVPDGLDYVALGHFHRFSKVRDRAYYSGSTERTGFGEAGQSKGIVEVDLDRNSVRFHELAIRDMLVLDPIDASDLSATEIARDVRSVIETHPIEGKIVRIHINGVRPEVSRSLDMPGIRRMGADALVFDPRIGRAEGPCETALHDASIGALAQEFRKYVEGLNVDASRKENLLNRGVSYFSEEDA
ncbi:MAG: exonuclease SbcCD subunit D [Methanobacteriota archaeon]|nr:MAG: exonuclease SbcCD subunit D [Euryarchaeota archaeon]